MKKFICMLLSVLFCAGLFASDGKNFIDFGAHFPVFFEKAVENGVTAKTQITSIGIGMTSKTMFTKMVGLYAGISFYFPQKMKITVENISVEFGRENYKTLFGFEFLAGPAFMPVRTEKFGLSVAPGVHIGYLTAGTGYVSTQLWLFGAGADIAAEYYINQSFYLKGGIGLYYDFYGITTAQASGISQKESGKISDFVVKPQISLGFRY